MLTSLALMALLICLSGFFSGSETALFSLGKLVRRRFERSQDAAESLVGVLLAKPPQGTGDQVGVDLRFRKVGE